MSMRGRIAAVVVLHVVTALQLMKVRVMIAVEGRIGQPRGVHVVWKGYYAIIHWIVVARVTVAA
jgi:hypothetical protein